MISRRHFLSASAGAATMLAANARLASAESPQVVVGTWGGDYGQLLNDLVDKPILAPKGIEVLRPMKSLKIIGIGYDRRDMLATAEFWKKYDAGEFK